MRTTIIIAAVTFLSGASTYASAQPTGTATETVSATGTASGGATTSGQATSKAGVHASFGQTVKPLARKHKVTKTDTDGDHDSNGIGHTVSGMAHAKNAAHKAAEPKKSTTSAHADAGTTETRESVKDARVGVKDARADVKAAREDVKDAREDVKAAREQVRDVKATVSAARAARGG
jgi:hypothetical protein